MELKKEIQEAIDSVTIEMINDLDYGEEVELTKGFCLSHYCEEDVIVLNDSEEWEELLQIMTDGKEITFEILDNSILKN